MAIIKEFKEFISRGNVVDMAIGVVIGTAFTNIVSSLVKNVLTPLLSILTGKINMSTLSIKINDTLSITYGAFLQSIIDFLLIAVAIFAMVKILNTAREKVEKFTNAKEEEEKKEVKEPEISKEQLLLTEIRDLLKEKNQIE